MWNDKSKAHESGDYVAEVRTLVQGVVHRPLRVLKLRTQIGAGVATGFVGAAGFCNRRALVVFVSTDIEGRALRPGHAIEVGGQPGDRDAFINRRTGRCQMEIMTRRIDQQRVAADACEPMEEGQAPTP